MKPVKNDVQFPRLETNILAYWAEEDIIKKGLKLNEGEKPFIFYDGPPFATGTPHYGHILPGTLKDIVPRYWVMKGRHVERRWGWDCHGLPVEFEMEKELGLNGVRDIEKLGIAKFNEHCRSIVLRYTKEWEKTITRTGRWVDFENAYRTMDPDYMESVWSIVKRLWDKELIFEGHRVMPYSWRVATPLSNFEANLNYKDVQDPAITVKLRSVSDPNRHFLIWTTTPWTLPSNLAVALHPDIDYTEIKDGKTGEHYILAEARISAYYKKEDEFERIKTYKGKELAGQKYVPLFPYFKNNPNSFVLVLGDYVTTEEGTGLVHQAPAYGEDDLKVCQQHNIPLVDPVDDAGCFTRLVPDFEGQQVKDADKGIIQKLKKDGAVVQHTTIVHSYPFCWRSDTPLIYKAISTWFVKLEPIKKALNDNNRTMTNWVPEHLKEGRFGKWLENARDWNISRNRFWGAPIPLWRCTKECGNITCVGSRDELQELSGSKRLEDLHKHFVDEITLPCSKCNKPMKRIPEVLDCWFESGSMPYAKSHYQFEKDPNNEGPKNFPADFIAEGLDQTRGWFYTLSVLGNALFGKPPFKNVIVNGLILAEDGKKMSKSLKNYPDPNVILDTYGADALRAYLTVSPASRAEELRFSEAGVKEITRSVLLPYWNAYSFFVTYALADGWSTDQYDESSLDHLDNDLDNWILSKLQSLINSVDKNMENYHLYEVIPLVLGFIDDLTNWYIRLNRRRFWKSEKGTDKTNAYNTLYYTLTTFTKVLAPILPFITEEVYQNLERTKTNEQSVHFTKFPEVNAKWQDKELEGQMTLVENVVAMGRNLRSLHKLKTRQPLKELMVISEGTGKRVIQDRFDPIIQQELNVKKVSYSSDPSQYVDFIAKPDLKRLGRRLGKKMKVVGQRIRELSSADIAEFQAKGSLEIEGETLTTEDVLIDYTSKKEGVVQTNQGLIVWLDTQFDDALVAEGRAREFVNRIQKLRKDIGLEVTDRIHIKYECPKDLGVAIDHHKDYISTETLAESLAAKDATDWTATQEIDGHDFKVRIDKC